MNLGEVYICDKEFICEMFYVKSKERENKAPSLKETEPCTIMQVTTVQERQVEKMWKVLLDSESTHSFVKQSILPVGTIPTLPPNEQRATITRSSEAMCKSYVTLRGVTLPEFSKSLQVSKHTAWIHDNENVRYDAIYCRSLRLISVTRTFQWKDDW